jgi:hypothetical protein
MSRLCVFLVLPLLPGCFLPEPDRNTHILGSLTDLKTAPIDLADAHVFRIDNTAIHDSVDPILGSRERSGDYQCRVVVSELPLSYEKAPNGEKTASIRVQKEKGGWSGYLVGTPLYLKTRIVERSFSLVLYRPGFKLIAEDGPTPLEWKHAEDLWAQVGALDQLFFPGRIDGGHGGIPMNCWVVVPLEPGSASPAHRKALLFGASEYERLAGLAMKQPDLNRRERSSPEPWYARVPGGEGPWDQPRLLEYLHEKSKSLRDLADK